MLMSHPVCNTEDETTPVHPAVSRAAPGDGGVQSCARRATYWAFSGSSMQVSQTQALGEELLREPVKRVNNVSKLLTALGSAKCDEVCP